MPNYYYAPIVVGTRTCYFCEENFTIEKTGVSYEGSNEYYIDDEDYNSLSPEGKKNFVFLFKSDIYREPTEEERAERIKQIKADEKIRPDHSNPLIYGTGNGQYYDQAKEEWEAEHNDPDYHARRDDYLNSSEYFYEQFADEGGDDD